jgi:hypothetical protein
MINKKELNAFLKKFNQRNPLEDHVRIEIEKEILENPEGFCIKYDVQFDPGLIKDLIKLRHDKIHPAKTQTKMKTLKTMSVAGRTCPISSGI